MGKICWRIIDRLMVTVVGCSYQSHILCWQCVL